MGLSGFHNRQPWLKWEQIEKFLGQKLPFGVKGQNLLDNMSWIEGYVQDMLKKAMPQGTVSSHQASAVEVVETHDHIIVQAKLGKEENPRAMQVFVKSNAVKITGYLNGERQIVKLPALVLPRTAKARYKQRMLQVQIRKRGLQEGYQETYIRY
uniref:Uncharacterized protein n=2 Tax=Paenibacillus athensensis TaxID=1967502 RepID=A0A4Y8Q3A7_9BACL